MPPLSIIDLSYNSFNSSSSFDLLVNLSSSGSLIELDLSNNYLLGNVPEAIQYLVSLERLHLPLCSIQGEFPKSFTSLPRLCYLDLNKNELTGSLPDLMAFPFLSELYLRCNKLNGSIPESFAQISSLVCLDLSENRLTGPLPDLAFLSSLRELRLGVNKLNGRIPKSLSQLLELEIVEAYSNWFEGMISEAHLSNLTKLNELDLSWNSLRFKMNSSWIPPFQLEVIKLASCKLGPRFPNWLQSQENFSLLDISNAKISDALPIELEHLNVSNNQINGPIGNLTLKNWVGFQRLDLTSNHFHGPVPVLPATMQMILLSKNMLTGSISSLCQNFCTFFDVSDNLLSGHLPDCLTKQSNLVFLNLANNNFSGRIPSSVGNLSSLVAFELRNNNFTGEMPLSLMKCSALKIIDFSLNKFRGKVPRMDWNRSPKFASSSPGDEVVPVPPSIDYGKDEDRFTKMGFYVSVALGFIVGFWCFCGPLLLKRSWRHAYFKKMKEVFDYVYVIAKVKKQSLLRKLRR